MAAPRRLSAWRPGGEPAYTWMAPTYDSSVETLEKGIADHYRKHVFQGVGTGRIFNFLRASEVRSFMGVDLNEAMLAEARKKLGDLPFEILGDGHALPFPEKSFDTVIGSMCLCAMEDPGTWAWCPIRHTSGSMAIGTETETGEDDNDVYALLESCQHLKVNRVGRSAVCGELGIPVQVRGMGNWYLVREVQQKHVQAAREAQARRKQEIKKLKPLEDGSIPTKEGEQPELPAAAEGEPLQEMDSSTSRSRLGIHAPGLPDSAIALAERLLSAKSPGEVLTLGTKAVEALHTEVDQEQRSLRLGQIALSLQLLARQADGPRKAVILKDRRLAGMVESLKENAEELEVWILAAGSCALGRLASLSLGAAQATGPAHEALLACSQKKLSTFEVAQAALVLASLASVPERLASPVGRQLRESLVSTLELQSQELSPDACAHLAPALVKLRDQSAELAKGVAKRLGTGVSAVPPELLATAAKSLAALRQAPLQLMEATEQAMRRQIHLCTPRAVVYFASALSEGRGGVDAFKDFLMPAARSFILDFGCRDLCTLAECFVKASCSDPDFLADVAERLQRKVPEMGAHEVSVAFQVFAPVSYAVPQFFPAMAEKAKDLADELSPKQLTHTLQGLHSSRWADEQLLKALAARAQQLSHVLFGTHAVSVILALADAQHLDERLLRSLSETVLRSLDRLAAQDYIALLSSISQLSLELRNALPVSFLEEVLQALRLRGYGPWRLELEAVVNLLEALHGLRLEDEVLLEVVLDRLPAALQLSEINLILLVRLIETLGELPKRSRAQVAAHLHRRPKLQNALRDCITQHVIKKNLDLEARVAVAKALARLGFQDTITQEQLTRLTISPDLSKLSLEACCDLSFALASHTWAIEWNRRFAWKILRRLYLDAAPNVPEADGEEILLSCDVTLPRHPGALLRLAWALSVLNEALPMPLLKDLAEAPWPRDWGGYGLRQLQEVALHHKLQAFGEESRDLSEWIELVLEVPREDQYVPLQPRRAERGRKQISAARCGVTGAMVDRDPVSTAHPSQGTASLGLPSCANCLQEADALH
ncbi:Uncharacterized protein SCF082_LOCUS28292 [Durusdinium trenchii]|uniref:Methyltransferase type 11 domain-containing protein n=1 Tax=Durusdinium trenchii TaxID=1381693 RepID=A0ABP0MLF4_9DINO